MTTQGGVLGCGEPWEGDGRDEDHRGPRTERAANRALYAQSRLRRLTPWEQDVVVPDRVLRPARTAVDSSSARWGSERLGQPRVLGEIVAGIVISTSPISSHLLPHGVLPSIGGMANLSLALFVFRIGYELDFRTMAGRRQAALRVGVAATVLPLLGGLAAGIVLSHRYAVHSQLGFIALVGIAMSITAFPVLARVLADEGIASSPIGTLALSASAVGDAGAWIALAAVVTVSGASGAEHQWRAYLFPVYLVLMLVLVRPLLRATLLRLQNRPSMLTLALVGLLLSCAITQWIGVQFVFGAVAFGAVLPRAGRTLADSRIREYTEQFSTTLLPLYFVLAGSQLDLGDLSARDWPLLILIVGLATISKVAGCYLGSRLARLPTHAARQLAVLMNMRGLTEIVIASTGLQMHLIDRRMYSLLVLMAIITTGIASPLLRTRWGGIKAVGLDSAQVAQDLVEL